MTDTVHILGGSQSKHTPKVGHYWIEYGRGNSFIYCYVTVIASSVHGVVVRRLIASEYGGWEVDYSEPSLLLQDCVFPPEAFA